MFLVPRLCLGMLFGGSASTSKEQHRRSNRSSLYSRLPYAATYFPLPTQSRISHQLLARCHCGTSQLPEALHEGFPYFSCGYTTAIEQISVALPHCLNSELYCSIISMFNLLLARATVAVRYYMQAVEPWRLCESA